MSSDKERETGLKALTLARAIECATKTLEACWDEAWEDKDTAAKVYEEDGKKEHEFRFKVSLPLVIRPKGSGNIDVSMKARWGVVKTCELETMTVSDHPEMESVMAEAKNDVAEATAEEEE